MATIKMSNLALRFFFELCALVALGYWGFHTGANAALRVIMGVGAPLLAAIFWGLFGAPRAKYAMTGYRRLIPEAVVFGLAVVALIAAGQTTIGVIFAIVFVINDALNYAWKQ